MVILYLFISLALLVASHIFTIHIRCKIYNLPPTIFPSLPIIGHLCLFKAPMHRTLAKISAKYGPIILLKFGSRRVLLVSSPSIAEECLTKNDIVFANRPKMLSGKIIRNNYTGLPWTSYSDHWRNLRRIASIEILSISRLNKLQVIREDEGRFLVRKLLSSSSPVNMKTTFYEMTLNVMMRMISGKRYFGGDIPNVEEEGKQFKEMIDEVFELTGASSVEDYLPILKWLGIRGVEKKLLATQKKRDVYLQGLISQLKKRKEGDVKNKNKTMIEVFLSLQKSDPDYYTDEMIQTTYYILETKPRG